MVKCFVGGMYKDIRVYKIHNVWAVLEMYTGLIDKVLKNNPLIRAWAFCFNGRCRCRGVSCIQAMLDIEMVDTKKNAKLYIYVRDSQRNEIVLQSDGTFTFVVVFENGKPTTMLALYTNIPVWRIQRSCEVVK